MQRLIASWILLACLLCALPSLGQTAARDYYTELYKAGGLDRMADEYVCFDDSKDLDTFFIFGKSETLKQFLIDQGGFAKLSPKNKKILNDGYLNVRGYDKGVALSSEEMYYKDGDTWSTEKGVVQGWPMRVRLSISFETLRYKKTVEILNPNGSLKSEVSRYGRCESVSGDVRQKAN
jgi:hypothetical protein